MDGEETKMLPKGGLARASKNLGPRIRPVSQDAPRTSPAPSADFIPSLTRRLLEFGKPSCQDSYVVLTKEEIISTLALSTELLKKQDILIEVQPPVFIVGDIHGQFLDLLRIFKLGSFPPVARYLFLGDYVDRGKHSIETMLLLLCLKLSFNSDVRSFLANFLDHFLFAHSLLKP